MEKSCFFEELVEYKNIIIANGLLPHNEIAQSVMRAARFILCCDGAIGNLESTGITPDLIIGDCDSISKPLYEKYNNIIIEDKDTECNDLQKALRYCVEHHLDDIAILGGTGLREDHALANIGILLMYANKLNLVLVTDHCLINAIGKTTRFPSYRGQQVSVFSFNRKRQFTFHNLVYPVVKRHFDYLWEGSLNESEGDHFIIETDTSEDAEVIVMRTIANIEK